MQSVPKQLIEEEASCNFNVEILPATEYMYIYLRVASKFKGALGNSILDKDDVISTCYLAYVKAKEAFSIKVQEGYAGSFDSYLYTSCVREVYKEVNSNKRGFRLTKYALEQELKKAFNLEPYLVELSNTTTLDSYQPNTLKCVQSLDDEGMTDKIADKCQSNSRVVLDYLLTFITNELDETILVMKYQGYTAEEIGKSVGVTAKYITKRWASLKRNLKGGILANESYL